VFTAGIIFVAWLASAPATPGSAKNGADSAKPSVRQKAPAKRIDATELRTLLDNKRRAPSPRQIRALGTDVTEALIGQVSNPTASMRVRTRALLLLGRSHKRAARAFLINLVNQRGRLLDDSNGSTDPGDPSDPTDPTDRVAAGPSASPLTPPLKLPGLAAGAAPDAGPKTQTLRASSNPAELDTAAPALKGNAPRSSGPAEATAKVVVYHPAHEEEILLRKAALALSYIHDSEAVDTIAELLSHKSEPVRLDAVAALSAAGTETAAFALEAYVVVERNKKLRALATKQLTMLRAKLGPPPEKLRMPTPRVIPPKSINERTDIREPAEGR